MASYRFTAGATPGERVRAYREAKGLSQGELGDRLTPSRTHAAVSDIERGKTRMNVDLADELATVLGVTRWELLGDDPARVVSQDETVAALLAALVRAEQEIARLRAEAAAVRGGGGG